MLLIAAFEIKNVNLAVLVSVLLKLFLRTFHLTFGTVLCDLPLQAAPMYSEMMTNGR